MSGTHHFHVGAAIEVGVNAAIILEQFDFYITKNKANGRHYHDGRYWTYNSVSAFKDMYPYMSEKSIRTAISKLVDGGYVLVGDYNKNRYQRPKWYSVTDEGYRLLDESYRPKGQHVLPETAERDTQNGNSHIVSSSYSSTSSSYISSELPNREKTSDESFEGDLKAIVDHLNAKVGSRYTTKNKQLRGYVHARLDEGFTVDDFFTVIDTKSAKWRDDPKMRDYLRPSTLFAPSHFEEYLNEAPQTSILDTVDWSKYQLTEVDPSTIH